MIRPRPATLIAVFGLGAAVPALGATNLTADMTNAQENPPAIPTTTTGQPRPASFGTAIFVLSDDQTQMTMVATVNNIDFTGTQTPNTNDNLTAAHIHASPTGTATTNAGVVWGFFGAPFNDIAPNDQVVTPFASGVGGTINAKWDAAEGQSTTLTAQIPNILSQHAYVNFHTTQFGGGEVRGFLVVPEPSAVTACLALSGLALRRSRRV